MFALLSSRAQRRALAVLIVFVAALATITASHVPAAHAGQGACRGAMWGLLTQDICVVTDMGGKDYAHHRQWVSNVEADQHNNEVPSLIEIWGDGFYYKAIAVNKAWTINKWVRSNTNICAAETDNYGVREVACIHVHV